MTDFSNYTNPFQGGQAADPGVITVNLGLGTTDGVLTGLVPEGTHTFEVFKMPEVNTSSGNELMITITTRVAETNVPEAKGAVHTEQLLIPGELRKQNEPDKWKFMMKMLRHKLEGLTGRPWREDNLSIRPAEFFRRFFVATCTHEVTKKVDDEGNEKTYTNSRLRDWVAVGTQANPAGQMAFQPGVAQEGNGQTLPPGMLNTGPGGELQPVQQQQPATDPMTPGGFPNLQMGGQQPSPSEEPF